MLEMIRYNGGLDFITSGLTKRIHSKRGAEVSIAGLAGISSLSIIEHLYYPFVMGICALLAILFRLPRKYS